MKVFDFLVSKNFQYLQNYALKACIGKMNSKSLMMKNAVKHQDEDDVD